MKARFPTLFIVLLAALGLAGCFTSNQPLFGDDQAVAPYAKITFVKHDASDAKTATLTREGKAYVTKTKDGTVTMRFMPLGDDLYLAESSAEQKGQTMRLYGVVKLDKAKLLAVTYKTFARDGDIGPGLPACKADNSSVVCIEDVNAFVALAKAAIAAGDKPDTVYDVTLQ